MKKLVASISLIFSLIFSEHAEKVTLVATGCLTNYALLFSVFPEVKKCISQLVLLGGAMVLSKASYSNETRGLEIFLQQLNSIF